MSLLQDMVLASLLCMWHHPHINLHLKEIKLMKRYTIRKWKCFCEQHKLQLTTITKATTDVMIVIEADIVIIEAAVGADTQAVGEMTNIVAAITQEAGENIPVTEKNIEEEIIQAATENMQTAEENTPVAEEIIQTTERKKI